VPVLLQGIPGSLPWGVMQTYINDYLHLNKGLSVELATTVLLLFAIGCAVGVIAGGAAGQALYNWYVWRQCCGSWCTSHTRSRVLHKTDAVPVFILAGVRLLTGGVCCTGAVTFGL